MLIPGFFKIEKELPMQIALKKITGREGGFSGKPDLYLPPE
jgi:hypothetical protein